MTENKTNVVPSREEVQQELTWDLTNIFKNEKEWEKNFEKVKQLTNKSEKFKGMLGKSADHLLNALQFRDQLLNELESLYVYAHLKLDQDTTNPFYQSLYDRSKSLWAQVASSISFYEPEILSIDEEKLADFIETKTDLKLYHHMLKELNLNRPYVLSEKEEALLASAGEVLNFPSTTFNTLNNADIKFKTIRDENGEKIELTHGRYHQFIESKDRRVRREAFKDLYEVYEGLKNTMASTLNGHVKKSNFYAKIRGYKSAREAALFDNHIPEEVYDALVQSVNAKQSLLHRYIALRKEILRLDEIRMYDLYVPLSKTVDLSFSYNEAKEVILEALKPLGEEYQSILEKAFRERWIDVVENKGKRSGAYSSGSYNTNPYILLNWQKTLDNLFTLAHELGHSVHSYYTRKNQPYIYGRYSIFLAEVASTANENLLIHYLLAKYDSKEIQAYLINHYIDGFKGTVYRQTQFAEFEHLIHQADQNGTALTAEFLTEVYFDLNKKYYGEQVTYDKEIGYEWSRIPHFYMDYYVYQYATGYSAASALSAKILNEGPPAVEAYINFLKSGSSDFPIEILKRAGVDMTTPKPINDALSLFEKRLTELEQLFHK